MDALNQTAIPQLLCRIGLPDTLLIMDISIGPDFADVHILIPGAYRPPHTGHAGFKEQLGSRVPSVGLSRQSRNDQAELDACVALDDAAYLWVCDGTGGGYDWPAERRS